MSGQPFARDRHDTRLVAAFEQRPLAEKARRALLGAGVPADVIEVVGTNGNAASPPDERFWRWVQRRFGPYPVAMEPGDAVDDGHVAVVVHPQTLGERDTVIEVLNGCGPIDLEEQDEPGHAELNHATYSRAELLAMQPIGAELFGTEPEPAPAPMTPAAAPAEKPTGTTYTYGVPESVARAMSAPAPSDRGID